MGTISTLDIDSNNERTRVFVDGLDVINLSVPSYVLFFDIPLLSDILVKQVVKLLNTTSVNET